MSQAHNRGTPSGAWLPGATAPRSSAAAFQAALAALGSSVVVVAHEGRPAVAVGGRARLGVSPGNGSLPLLAHAPALRPSDLGDASFRSHHGVEAAYVVGEMANGIASEELVEAAARAGFLAVFGAAGLPIARVEKAIHRLKSSLAGLPWGVNLIHSPDDPRLEAALVSLLLASDVPFVSASAYLDLTLSVVRYRVAGIHRDPAGAIVARRLMAKVSRVEVARRFLEPPPERFLTQLIADGSINAEQAQLAASIPMVDDLTAEADSGGHTDNRPLVLLLPALQALRDDVTAQHHYSTRVRVGAAGGIATPASVASAFAMGAAYVVTGSVNQAALEAGTSDAVRQMLAQAAPSDVAMAPAADMFEMGVKVQVLTRGTLFAVRAARLHDLYRTHGSVAELPATVREELEKKYFRCTLEAAWEDCRRFFAERDPEQLERAAKDPRHQFALLLRSYLGQASKWANSGVADRKLDYQVWCGPSMGAFNEWAKGSFLESWDQRGVVVIGKNLLAGAAVLTRAAALRTQGVSLPPEAQRFAPRTEAELDAIVLAPTPLLQDDAAPVITRVTSPITLEPVGRPQDEPIAIVGMGAMFPQAPNLESFWRLLRTGRDALSAVPESYWSVDDYYDPDPRAPDKTYAKRGAFLSPQPFDSMEFGIPPAILEATDTSQLLGLVVARMAMEDAGYGDGRAWDRSRASAILGVTGTQELVISLGARLGHPKWRKALRDAGVDEDTADDVVKRIGQSYVGWQENSFPGLLGNVVAGRIANRLDLGGTNCVIDAACASSLGALHVAMLELRAQRSDLVLTGGVDCLNDIFMHMCFSKTPALSPSGDVRPFSDEADGTLLGEGIGMIVLKRLSDAVRDGDRVHALIKSLGTSGDGRAKSIYAPLASGQARALREAYELAGVSPRDISLVEAHGTGTKAGDAAEFEALRNVYGADSDDVAWCTLGTVKSQIGHTKAAAGAAGLIKAALALEHAVLPPTLKVSRPHPGLKVETSPFTFTAVARPWISRADGPRLAAVSSFGFGGSNYHAVLEESGRARTAPAWDGSVELLALSAKDAPSLLALAQECLNASDAERTVLLARLRGEFDSGHAHRLLAAISEDTPLAALLAPAIERIQREPGASFSLPDGVHHGCGPAVGKLAFLFAGQGAQHVGMLRELTCIFPEMLDALERDLDVARAIHPLPTFDDAEHARREAHLTGTAVAQPALAAVGSGVLEVMGRFGVTPDLVAGHSHGELVALHAAGVFDALALDAASKLRGTLMAGDGEDRGTMLAVFAPLDELERLVAQERLDVVLANRNAPKQGVLSGSRAAIERAETLCRERGLATSRLAVGAAFHGPLVASAAKDFRAGLERIQFAPPRIPVIANSTGAPYPVDAPAAKDLLANQLARPVNFVDVVERLHAEGARTFVELGPKTAVTGMLRAILGTRPFVAMALDAASPRGGLFDLAQLLCRVAAAGHRVQFDAWQRVTPPQHAPTMPTRKPRMTVALSGVNHRAPVEVIPPRMAPAAPSLTAPAAPSHTAPAAPSHTAPAAPSHTAPTAPSHIGTAARSARAEEIALANHRSTETDATLIEMLKAQQEAIRALQSMQEQTARAHQIFLAGQQSAQEGLQALMLGTAPRVAGTTFGPFTASAPAPHASVSAPAAIAAPVVIPAVARAPVVAAPLATQVIAPVIAPVVTDVVPILFDVVALATGYPAEELGLEMDLEADLGIDSIKRVEILSMLSKRIPGAPSVDPEKLGALRTLAHVADFVRGSAPVTASAPQAKPTPAHAPASLDESAILLEVVSQLTGYPMDSLALDLDMESDLGIDSIKRVEILSMLSKRIPGAPSVDPEKLSDLRTLADVLAFISGASGAMSQPPRVTTPNVVAALEVVDAVALADAARVSVDEVVSSTERSVVVPVQAPDGITVPLPSAPIVILADHVGLADSLARAFEKLGHAARVVRDAAEVTGAVGGLILLAPDEAAWTSASETSLKAALRATRELGPRLRAAGNSAAFLAAVSRRDGAFGQASKSPSWNALQGGLSGLAKTMRHEWPEVRCRAIDVAASWPMDEAARAIVAELSLDGPLEVGLGPVGRLTLALRRIDASPVINRLQAGDVVVVTGGARGVTAECARALALRTRASLVLLGRSKEPASEPAWLAAASTEAQIKQALLANAPAGQRPSPKMVGESCRALLAGREIRVGLRLLEEAGVSAQYRAVDVRDEQSLASVLADVRSSIGPIRGVIHGAGVLRDKRIEDKSDDDFDQVLDTKLAGLRSLLAATAQDELRFMALFASVTGRFGRRGQSDYAVANQALVSIAQVEAAHRPECRVVALDWGPWEGGMVTAPLKAQFEREGVTLIPLAAGASALCDEALSAPPGPAEVVVGSGLPAGFSTDWALASSWMLDPATFPVLKAHVLGGKAVLPFAMTIEWFVEAATRLTGHAIEGLEDVRVLRGITLGETPECASVWVGPFERGASGIIRFALELRGARGHVHVRATATAGPALPGQTAMAPPTTLHAFPTSMQSVYAEQLFHGHCLEAIEGIDGMAQEGMTLRLRTHPTSERLLPGPGAPWTTDPLALDGVFQALIVWCRAHLNAPSLPSSIASVRLLGPLSARSLRAIVQIRAIDAALVTCDVDLQAASGELLARLRGVACTVSSSLDRAFGVEPAKVRAVVPSA